MPARSVRIERRNPQRPRTKNYLAPCGLCGECGFKYDLIEQRGILVNRTHETCYDDPVVYQGVKQRPPAYGRQP